MEVMHGAEAEDQSGSESNWGRDESAGREDDADAGEITNHDSSQHERDEARSRDGVLDG